MDKFCYLPWVGLDISPQGKIKPCCKYQNNISDNIDDYYSSQELKSLRESFARGDQPSACQACWRDEDAGIESKRQIDWKYSLEEAPLDVNVVSILSLPFGNTCNLACRTCNSNSSSRWLTEEKKLVGIVNNLRLAPHQTFYKDSKFLNNIKNLISHNIKYIEFPGGEPFITGVNEHLEFLDYLIDHCNSQNIRLHYITNTTVFPSQLFWSRWEKFKNVDIQLSIDGTGEQFEYIRWPAQWHDCYRNIKQYQEYKLKYPNIQLSISHTLSIYNVHELPLFIYWCRREKLPQPHIVLVSSPDYYSISNLAFETKQRLSQLKGMPKNIINELGQQNYESSSTRLDKTLKYIKILDKQRNQNFAETFPEYYQLLRETCPTLSQLY